MNWRPFKYGGQIYNLSHVHDFEWTYILPAKKDKPERHYPFDVTFSIHTFTKGIKPGEEVEQALLYRDSRETRRFDFDRYELSKQLSNIVRNLGQRKCHHTQNGNFFTVELTGEGEKKKNYEVYFAVSKSGKNPLRLFIQSAYERTCEHGSKPKRKPPIGFHVIAHNTMHKKPIKVPK